MYYVLVNITVFPFMFNTQLFIHAEDPGNLLMSLVRDEYPNHPLVMKGTASPGVNVNQKYQPAVMLEKSYTVHWDGRAPEQVTIYPINFDR